jgi:hypothetical protein
MPTARELARSYDQYVFARWRGEDEAVVPFATWLAGFWGEGPPEPATAPAAISVLGGAGRGIRWHEVEGNVLGYVRGWTGQACYQIPAAAAMPSVSTAAWDVPGDRRRIERRRWARTHAIRQRQRLTAQASAPADSAAGATLGGPRPLRRLHTP